MRAPRCKGQSYLEGEQNLVFHLYQSSLNDSAAGSKFIGGVLLMAFPIGGVGVDDSSQTGWVVRW